MDDPILYSPTSKKDNDIEDEKNTCQYCGVIPNPQEFQSSSKHFNEASPPKTLPIGEKMFFLGEKENLIETIKMLAPATEVDKSNRVSLIQGATFSSSLYECNQCGIRVNSKNFLDHMKSSSHMKCILGNKKYMSTIITEKGYFDGTVYGCWICKLFVQGVSHLQLHFFGMLHEENLTECASKTEGSTSVKICNLIIPRGRNSIELPFLNGIISDKKELMKYFCLICNAPIETLNDLGTHFLLKSHQDEITKIIMKAMTEEVVFNTIEEEPLENEAKTLIIPFDVMEEIKHNLHMTPILNRYDGSSKHKNSDMLETNENYDLEDLTFETMVFECEQEKRDRMILSVKRSCYTLENCSLRYCLCCSITFDDDYDAFVQHFHKLCHTRKLEEFDESVFLKPFIKKVSDKLIRCYICHDVMENDAKALGNHLNLICHNRKADELDKDLKEFSLMILNEYKNVWYRIHQFACVLCDSKFSLKINFIRHCRRFHFNKLYRHLSIHNENCRFDFCITCGCIWLESKSKRSIHFDNKMHKHLDRTKLFVAESLPQNAENFLLKMDKHIDEINNQKSDDENEEKLLKKLKKHFFSTVDIHPIGSRVTGLCSSNSDFDVYVNKEKFSHAAVTELVETCSKLNDSWRCNGIIQHIKFTIIKLQYNQISLRCNLYFLNELCLENTKLISFYVKLYEPCRKLFIFLKKWLFLIVLPGPTDITSYTLSWMLIFYLQHKHDLPSVVDLLSTNKLQETSNSGNPVKTSVRELITGFFKFFGEFDYRQNVICPFLGSIITKETFTDPKKLPKEMELYNRQLNSYDCKYFNIHAVMCLQDPIDLSFNLTQSIETITLNHFKEYCKKSLNIIESQHFLLTKIKELNSSKNNQFVVMEPFDLN